jgi:hypothetical protein
MKNGILIFSLLLFFFACSKNNAPSREDLISDEIEFRANKFIQDRVERCRVKYMTQIEYEVDSMMYFLVQKIKGTDDQMPSKPLRPDRLVDTIKLDSFKRIDSLIVSPEKRRK